MIIGSTGAVGSALLHVLQDDLRCGQAIGLSRSTQPPVDFEDETTIEHAAAQVAEGGDVHLVIDATGMLHDDLVSPEKALSQISPAAMHRSFLINTTGPALLLKYFHRLLPRRHKSCFASLSARVGSIGDNRLGGWYGYRASKAALNMIIKTAAIELARTRPDNVCLAIHPGTVQSPLSQPFAAGTNAVEPEVSALHIIQVIDQTTAEQSGSFLAYDGQRVDW